MILIKSWLVAIILCKYLVHGDQSSNNVDENGKLIFVHVLFRHGDRTPIDPYPNDPWGNRTFWPVGWGQLTNLGKQQHYNLGKWLRNRYDNLISDKYSKDTVFIRSTDVDRTLMSAEADLAGLFPPTKDQLWNPSIPWQPIPVHTMPENMDELLAAKKSCPAYDYALKKYKKSEDFVRLNKRFQGLYEYLTEHSGKKVDSPTGVNNLYNNLFIEDLYNMSLPEWTKKVYPGGDMQWLAARSFATNTYTPKLARLKVGFLIKEMFQRFSNKSVSLSNPKQSVWIYSAHDTTVANLLNALGLFELHTPPYTACVLLELRLKDDVPMVQIFYKNSTNDPHPMYIPHCGISCPLEKLYQIYDAIIPGRFEDECRLSILTMTYEDAEINASMGFLIGGCILLLLVLSVIAILTFSRRRSYPDSRWYTRIDS
ncbi:prostatic acid phosphatase-like [Bradysia coprophila]|uniref:prostatic acid phosphatase-like n=1 Tax=Bradysia coprophila TaxID=38358 RepID=UPI00187D82C2|nr:prostatic acid phosphatase-like [Bradysia coprophila]